MWFLIAIAALLCWSGSDIFSKVGSKQNDKNSQWKMVIAVGLVMGAHAAFEIFVNGVEFTFGAMLQYLPASLLYIGSMVLGYISLRYIELSVSSPICNSSGAVAALICFMLYKIAPSLVPGYEIPDWPVWLGVAIVAAGVVSLGIVEYRESQENRDIRQDKALRKYQKSFLALLLPVLYCLIDAAGTAADYSILQNMDEDVANVAYELTFLVMGIIAAIYVFGIRREKISFPSDGHKLLGGVCETAGQFAYIYAIANEQHATASMAIISAYCAVSAIWGRIFLKEKLSLKHYISIAVALVGIVILGVFDA